MLRYIWDMAKAAAEFVYRWITVIVGVIIVAPTAIIEFLNAIQAVDWAPLVSQQAALAIGAITAVAKALIASGVAAYNAAQSKTTV